MQVFMILLNIACNMQNIQNNMHDMQNMQTSFPICRICTAHFADDPTRPVSFKFATANLKSQLEINVCSLNFRKAFKFKLFSPVHTGMPVY